MYNPKAFQIDDIGVMASFMREHNFATLVTHGPDGLEASHLPFIVHRNGNGLPTLHAHLARANPQWQHFEGAGDALVIFQGPHAYVSPRLYETHPSVPTWNYQVVHAYGKPVVVSDTAHAREHVLELAAQHEAGNDDPWDADLPAPFFQGLLQQIVAIQIEVARVEGKFKLSQNRSLSDRRKVAGAFEASPDPLLQTLGSEMRAALGES